MYNTRFCSNPEIELLLASLDDRSLPRDRIDWPAVSRLANDHRLTPRLLRYLASHPEIDAPDDTLSALRNSARANAQRALAQVAHARAITDALSNAGIDVIVLKGVALSQLLYGGPAERMSCDLDLLVRRRDLWRAIEMFQQVGYASPVAITPAAIRSCLRFEHEIQWYAPDGTLIELHADLAQPHYSFRTDLERWFEAAVPLPVGGYQLRVLTPEHSLQLAVLHGTKHIWSRLDMVADVYALFGQDLDHCRVERELAAMGAARALAVARVLCARLFGGKSPDGVLARFIGRWSMPGVLQASAPNFWQMRLFDLTVRERLSDKARYAVGLARRLGS